MTRLRLALLGLCSVVVSLMIFSPSPTHAEAAKWLILNTKGEVKTASELKANYALEFDAVHGTLLVSGILKIHFTLLCNALSVIKGALGGGGALISGLRAIFSGCKVLLNGTLSEECTPKSNGKALGTVESNSLKGSIVTAEGERILIEPETGETYVTIEMGAACPIGNKMPILGIMYARDNEFTKHLEKHLLERDIINTKLWAISKTVEHTVTLTGSAWMYLTGEHKGLLWSGETA